MKFRGSTKVVVFLPSASPVLPQPRNVDGSRYLYPRRRGNPPGDTNIKYFFLHQSHYLSITYKPPPTRANAPPAARYAILNIEGRSLPRFSLLEKTTKRAK